MRNISGYNVSFNRGEQTIDIMSPDGASLIARIPGNEVASSYSALRSYGVHVRVSRNWAVVYTRVQYPDAEDYYLSVFNAYGRYRVAGVRLTVTNFDYLDLPKTVLMMLSALDNGVVAHQARHIVLDEEGLSSRRYGIEIECFVPERMNEALIAFAFSSRGLTVRFPGYTHAVTEYWKVVTDSSIHPISDYKGIEIVSPILSGKDGFEKIKLVCQALDELGALVNRSCGFHVHHDAADMSVEAKIRVATFYRNHTDVIDTMVSPSRRRDAHNSYCESLLDHTNRLPTESRYLTVNFCALRRHGTIEFRQHQGTTDYKKITEWIRFTQRIMDRAYGNTLSMTRFETLDVVLRGLGLESETRYFTQRVLELAQ